MRLLNERYLIQKGIGSGGMGFVYLAKDTKKNTTVAVKEYYGDNLSPREVRRIKREYYFLKTIHHPNIVRGLDFFQIDGKHYIVMEYVTGISLRDFIANKPVGVSFRKQLDIAKKLCLAVAEVNKHKVMHRDLKPGNIILSGQVM